MKGSRHKCKLPSSDESVTCVHWYGRQFMSGTDVAKMVRYRLQCRDIHVSHPKKFEEGIVSDLRTLKLGQDFVLEEARSEFLKFLREEGCIKTLKKQKVFLWDRIPHDRLFEDALERELMHSGTLSISVSECSEESGSDTPGVELVTEPELAQDVLDLLSLDQVDALFNELVVKHSMTYEEKMIMEPFNSDAFLREFDLRDYSTLAY